ncbi:MAG: metal ABC transporter ATP-binding protein [Methylovirgula sp.]
MSAIELRDLSLSLGGRSVLANVSLDIPVGTFIGVLGPNGAGKTTLMRAVLGLVPPSGGALRVFGQPATRGNPAIGYMPQVRGMVPGVRLSGWDFVASGANGHRLGLPFHNKAERADIDRVLTLVGAADLASRPLAEMSGGERQRLLLAQALLGHPQLLLLDEPLISLDPHRQTEVVKLVKKLQVDLGITVLFSAHELNPLLNAIDQVLYLGRGQAALGTVDDVITGPVLSRLYGTDIDVVRVKGRIFVMSGSHDVEHDEHRHDHGHDHGHEHAHGHAGAGRHGSHKVHVDHV